jgi:hypothetical protein
LVIAGIALIASAAAAEKTTKAQLIGSWTLVETENTLPNGTRFNPFENGSGMTVFDRTGHFSWILLRGDIPKIASGNRTQSTPEELKAVALGTLAYFGTYSLDEKTSTLTLHIQASSFANYAAQDQIRKISVKGDEFTTMNAAGASGGSAIVRWKRLK